MNQQEIEALLADGSVGVRDEELRWLLAQVVALREALSNLCIALRRNEFHDHLRRCAGCSASVHQSITGAALSAARALLVQETPQGPEE